MFTFINLVLLATLFVILLKSLSIFISEKVSLNREDLTSYECGFEFKSLSRLPFSFRYFLLTLVFLLFDLELVFLVFIPFSIFYRLRINLLFYLFIFIILLLLSLIYE